jgi:hypothetical protein
MSENRKVVAVEVRMLTLVESNVLAVSVFSLILKSCTIVLQSCRARLTSTTLQGSVFGAVPLCRASFTSFKIKGWSNEQYNDVEPAFQVPRSKAGLVSSTIVLSTPYKY